MAGTTVISVRCPYTGARARIRVEGPGLAGVAAREAGQIVPNAAFDSDGWPDYTYSLTRIGRGDGELAIRCNGRPLATAATPAEAFGHIRAHLRFAIASTSREPVFVHAGVVAWRGRAILLPGRTGTGKTTLVAELLRQGATYYSDEYALVGPEGEVHPFPCPLNLRTADGRDAQPARPERFGAAIGKYPAVPGLLLFVEYRPAARWSVRALESGAAVLRLLANTVAARAYPAEAIGALQRAAVAGPAFEAVRGEARGAAATILEMITRVESIHRLEGAREHA